MAGFRIVLAGFDWWFEGRTEACYYADIATVLEVGGEPRKLKALLPVAMIRVAESAERSFRVCRTGKRAQGSILGSDGLVEFLYEEEGADGRRFYGDGRVAVSGGWVQKGDLDYSIEHRADGIDVVEATWGARAEVPHEEYRREAIAFVEACRARYAEVLPSLEGRDRKRFETILGNLDSLVETGRPLAGFTDWDFGWREGWWLEREE